MDRQGWIIETLREWRNGCFISPPKWVRANVDLKASYTWSRRPEGGLVVGEHPHYRLHVRADSARALATDLARCRPYNTTVGRLAPIPFTLGDERAILALLNLPQTEKELNNVATN